MARKRREIPVVHVKERSNGRFAYFFEGIKVNGKRTQISKGGFASSEEALAAGEIAIVKYYFGGQAQIAHAVEAMKNNKTDNENRYEHSCRGIYFGRRQ